MSESSSFGMGWTWRWIRKGEKLEAVMTMEGKVDFPGITLGAVHLRNEFEAQHIEVKLLRPLDIAANDGYVVNSLEHHGILVNLSGLIWGLLNTTQ